MVDNFFGYSKSHPGISPVASLAILKATLESLLWPHHFNKKVRFISVYGTYTPLFLVNLLFLQQKENFRAHLESVSNTGVRELSLSYALKKTEFCFFKSD